MSSQSAKELVDELNKSKVEILKLKNSLNELNAEKESWFKKGEECSKKIRESIQKIKENKSKRDSLTQEVKALKPKRDGINKELALKLSGLNKLKKEKSGLAKSSNIEESSSRIKQQMEKLEFKIETDT